MQTNLFDPRLSIIDYRGFGNQRLERIHGGPGLHRRVTDLSLIPTHRPSPRRWEDTLFRSGPRSRKLAAGQSILSAMMNKRSFHAMLLLARDVGTSKWLAMEDSSRRDPSALDAAKTVWRFVIPERIRKKARLKREAWTIRSLPDRQFMRAEIFPWLVKANVKQVLSIGCRDYTVSYEHILARHGIELTTSDIDPEAAQFGAKRHVTADVTQLKSSDFPQLFDAILFNGVIGWGLDAQPNIDKALKALVNLIPPGAPFISGWNTGRSFDPDAQVYSNAGLDQMPGPTGVSRVIFTTVSHVYDFLRRRSELA